MDEVLRFSPALGDWVLSNLRQGCSPAQVAAAMRGQHMPADAARVIVDCEALIAMARPRLRPSTTVDPLTGRDRAGEHRSSLGMFFRLRENALVARLDDRVSQLMNLPVENGEGLQVLHYPAGARSAPHFDFLVPSNAANQASLERSGQRVSTLVSYLNDVAEGGETVFPDSGWSVSPQRGSAVYFEYCNSLGQLDRASLHAGAPVLRGKKWVATKWMRQRRFVAAR